MMNLSVIRYLSDNDASLSRIYLNGIFECYGLEDEFRTKKIYGETRIPAGHYKIIPRIEGGFHQRYINRFGQDFHKGMPWIQNVPNFTNVLIHIGNTDDDTAGCLLVGKGRSETTMTLLQSTIAYKQLYSKIIDAAWQGSLWITFIDEDRIQHNEN